MKHYMENQGRRLSPKEAAEMAAKALRENGGLDIVAEPDRSSRSRQPSPSDRVAGVVDSTMRDVAPMIDNAIKILFRGT